ncbi:MliC family protein [Neisseria montereyensis]|uniref:MliC family protein n=1 Tax=Neisseria montereyensis TaxID=2973938 RepID=A0ABT2FAA2_9NEIS|nr:MliC family protein [Neisseria montereyensis]MCS4533134.1 MliC family protein [Neisseria montereyensis]
MKTLKMLLPLTAALALAACVSGETRQGFESNDSAQAGYNRTPRPTQMFTCRNAFTVTVKDAGTDRVAVEYGLNDRKYNAVLDIAVSGSGERYVSADKKTSWHQKAGDGILSFTDPYGNVTETTCRLAS